MASIPPSSACYPCGDRDRLHRHHIDWNHDNNVPGNVLIICERCHVMLHKVGFVSREDLDAVRAKALQRDPARFRLPETPGAQPGLF